MSAQKVTAEQRAKALAEVAAGTPIKDVARKYGVTTSGVGYWMRTQSKRASNGKAITVKATVIADAHATRDAVVFLRKAKSELLAGIRKGEVQDFDSCHLLAMLALRSLQGQ